MGFAMRSPPRRAIAALRADAAEVLLSEEDVWLCMSCFACSSVCPARIPLTDSLMSTLKTAHLMKGSVPEELKVALENSRRYGNALGESARRRADWTRDFVIEVPLMARIKRPVDVLWWVGDYASYHPRAQATARATAKILAALGIDFGILGPEESSCGDLQLLAGERGLFELLATKNGKALAKYSFDQVVTGDPHAYNVMKNEYGKLGIELPVLHLTQYLHEQLDRLRPMLKYEISKRVTYHDPCALGRAHDNSVFEEPRELLRAIPGLELLEMPHSGPTSICCGGGGGGMWLDGFSWEKTHTRTSEWRIAEAAGIGAEVLAIACPFEGPRFEDAAKSIHGENSILVRDVSELLTQSMFD
jgi:Fe-S oxidoreductase